MENDTACSENIEVGLTVAIEFKCNCNCLSCMIKDLMDSMKPISFEGFKKQVQENLETGKYRRLILSGAEATMNKDLIEFVRYAKQNGKFKHIQIQTNGIKLADKEYCRKLIEGGVDEFFISVLGDSNALHDRITQLKGSFDKTMQGIENLGRFCVNVVTNTVVTSMNYERLQKIVGLISRYKHIKMMHFWNYWPMSKNDQDNMLVDLKIVAPCLKKAIEKCIDYRIKPVVKHFPACILGKYRNHLEDCGGLVIIDGKYWDEHKNNEFEQCKHKSVCNAKICDGLTTAYINKFGWEEDFLKPVKRDKESRNKNKFTPEFNMRKFMSHKKAFHIRDCSCVGLLENVIKKSRDFELECSVKVDGERVYPSRFNVYYHKANKRNLSLVFGFIKDVAKASGAVIDYSLIKNIIKKSDLAKMKNVVVGIDARENKKDSRIKLWFMIGNYPKKIEEIIRMFPKKDMVRDLVKDELLFGFDFFFDGRKAMKIYPSLSFDDINDKQMLKRIGQEFTKKTVPLMRKCKKVNISFKECSKDASFHFEVESLGVFMDNIGNNNTLKEVKKRIGKNAGNRGIISLNKKEIESSRFSSINIYY